MSYVALWISRVMGAVSIAALISTGNLLFAFAALFWVVSSVNLSDISKKED